MLSTSAAVLLCSTIANAQLATPQPPQPSGFTPVIPEHRQYSPQPSYPVYQSPTPPVIMGGTAESVCNQINGGNRGPGYGMSDDPRTNQQRSYDYIMEQMRNDPAYI